MEKIKYVHRQDCSFKLSAGPSGETSLNLSNEIFDLVAKGSMKLGEEKDVTFKIYKEDCIKAICFIILKLPLYQSSSTASIKIEDGITIFQKLIDKVNSIFGDKECVDYTVHLFYRLDGRIYLNRLKVDGFSIRDMLVENNSALLFKEEKTGEIAIRILSDIRDGESMTIEDADEDDESIPNSRQIIFYGAPGTGKSYEINERTIGQDVVRTTFHPDSDYSTFVGAYKPTMGDVTKCVVPVVVSSGISLNPTSEFKEKQITYKFVKQAFLKAYLAAWKKMCNPKKLSPVTFTVSGASYTVKSVGGKDLTYKKEATISKKDVAKIWNDPSFWVNGVFQPKTGEQSGTSLQQAIAKHIFDNYNTSKDQFDKGWKQLIDDIKNNGAVPVSKAAQTYTLIGVNGDDKIVWTSEANCTKDTLNNRYDNPNIAQGVEKGIIDKLKQYDVSSFAGAWKKLEDAVNTPNYAPQFLIIEEINRGNCAQIFGDLFQLLDRSDNGFSSYPIDADSDLQQAIDEAFTNEVEYQLSQPINVDGVVPGYESNYGATLSDDIRKGRILLLPPNLYILATMNTSDQSLFPIDSAFKRRWDWEYIPIGYKNENWTIEIGDKKYNWVDFQRIINGKIYDVDNSEDKQLGDYFVNADRTDGKISAETLLNKILFYIWNDVCKDDPEQIFRWIDDKEEKSIKFSEFFGSDRDKKLQGFMAFNKINAIGESENTDESKAESEAEGTETGEASEESETEVKS